MKPIGFALILACISANADWPQYESNPFVIDLAIPGPADNEDSAGGIVAADADNDGLPDYIVTCRGHVAVYAQDGRKLWVHETDVQVDGSSERVGLPGHHGPGVVAGDIDGDGKTEAIYFTRDSVLHVVDGATGTEEWTAKPPVPDGAARWEQIALASLSAPNGNDILIQATNKDGYRTGRYLAAYTAEALRAGDAPLWTRDDFASCAHNGARIADLDGDGLDEILGVMILNPDGSTANAIPLRGHVDSVFAHDVRPDLPGLEVVALEEGGGNRVFLFNKQDVIWITDYQNWEPQNAAVGRFDADRPGCLVWCRSRFNTEQKPFVFDNGGGLILQYELADAKPDWWTASGVETIWTIDWTGGEKQLACAKERHEAGAVCLFDPLTGAFVETFENAADRLYVADVAGDWREEMLVLNGSQLHIYWNTAPNPRPDRERLWNQSAYRRAKQTYNYYSP